MLQFVNGHIRQFILVSAICINTNNQNYNLTSYRKWSMFESFVDEQYPLLNTLHKINYNSKGQVIVST